MGRSQRGYGFGNENEWAETVAQNLQKMVERMDDREEEYRDLRDKAKHYLSGFEVDEVGKLKRIEPTEPVPYYILIDIIEGFYPAVTTPWWVLVDLAASRVIEINTILAQETLERALHDRLMIKLREWLGHAIYWVQKITVVEIEKRETKIRESTIGVLSRDAAPLLQKGEVGRETRKYIRTEAETRDMEDEEFDDDEDEEEDYL